MIKSIISFLKKPFEQIITQTVFVTVILQKEQKELVFLDQPDGKCLECRWNNAVIGRDNDFECSCPFTHITNPICIAKNTNVSADNVSIYFWNND